MNLLSFDVSAPVGSIAVFKDSVCVEYRENPEKRTHAAKLVPFIENALTQAQMTYGDLDGIVTGVGPGSFTGIRVGLATAKGLEIATGKPLYGLTSFEITHWKVRQVTQNPLPVLVVIDALREDVYCQYYSATGTPGTPQNLLPQDLHTLVGEERFILAGSGLSQVEAILKEQGLHCEALHETYTAEDLGNRVLSFTPEERRLCTDKPLEPFYLRSPDVNLS